MRVCSDSPAARLAFEVGAGVGALVFAVGLLKRLGVVDWPQLKTLSETPALALSAGGAAGSVALRLLARPEEAVENPPAGGEPESEPEIEVVKPFTKEPTPEMKALLQEHEVQLDGRTPEEALFDVAMGRFEGAKQTNEAVALQLKFMTALKDIATDKTLRYFVNQFYDIDNRRFPDGAIKELQWRAWQADPIGLWPAEFLAFTWKLSDSWEKKGIVLLNAGESQEKREALHHYRARFGEERVGSAIDDGDCFYDSLRQLLPGNETVASLRKIVSDAVAADTGALEAAYAQAQERGDQFREITWEQYKANVASNALDADVICWGSRFEAEILAEHFGVQIVFYGILGKEQRLADEDPIYLHNEIGAGDKIELANFRMHWIPIHPEAG